MPSQVSRNSLAPKPEKCCGGVIIANGKVLMVHQENGVYAFPKGHVEPSDQTELETAEREIFEETGVKTVLDAAQRFELFYHINESNIDKTVVLFLGRPENSTLTRAQEGEISAVDWVRINDVASRLQFPEWKAVWQRIYETLNHKKEQL